MDIPRVRQALVTPPYHGYSLLNMARKHTEVIHCTRRLLHPAPTSTRFLYLYNVLIGI